MNPPKTGRLWYGLRRLAFPCCSASIIAVAYGAPAYIASAAVDGLSAESMARHAAAPLWIAVYVLAVLAILGAIGFATSRSIRPGIFARDLGDPVYFGRRVYGCAWNCLYYFSPIYAACLAIGPLRWWVFRSFGYKGTLDFVIQPDTWIRDLPLLSFGKGAYLANKATLGTNVVLRSGYILVGRIRVGCRSAVGHGAALGPGVVVGDMSEIGVHTQVGVDTVIGSSVRIESACSISHKVTIEDRVSIGGRSCLGPGVVVCSGERLPVNSFRRRRDVARGDVIESEQDEVAL